MTKREYRICWECGKKMYEGYCIEGGLFYYCSDECLEENMTMSEYEELYNDGDGDSYWTEWDDVVDDEDNDNGD